MRKESKKQQGRKRRSRAEDTKEGEERNENNGEFAKERKMNE